jgi:hypothetical protein
LATQIELVHGMGGMLVSEAGVDGNRLDSIRRSDPTLRAKVDAILKECLRLSSTVITLNSRAVDVLSEALTQIEVLDGGMIDDILSQTNAAITPFRDFDDAEMEVPA